MPLHPGVGAGSPSQQGCGAGAAASWDMVPVSICWAGTEETRQGHGAGMQGAAPRLPVPGSCWVWLLVLTTFPWYYARLCPEDEETQEEENSWAHGAARDVGHVWR